MFILLAFIKVNKCTAVGHMTNYQGHITLLLYINGHMVKWDFRGVSEECINLIKQNH